MDASRFEDLAPAQTALLAKYNHALRHCFRGTYKHGLDAKGRMIIPVPFRASLGEKFCICLAPDFKAIALFPQLEWELYFCGLMELREKDMRMERIVTLFSRYTYDDCECDGQGRVLLPQALRSKFLGNVANVDISGATNYIRVTPAESGMDPIDQLLDEIPDVLTFEAEISRT